MPYATSIYFESAGSGYPLILGYPITASPVPEDPAQRILNGYLNGLGDLLQVVVMDYPNLGKSRPVSGCVLTVDQACGDVLRVADAAGFDRFIWWGYSWGGILGLLLAGSTDRLAALVCGGWPPIGNYQLQVLASCRATVHSLPYQQQYVDFYESMGDWPESRAVKNIRCPRMTYVGADDEVERAGIKMPTAVTLREHRAQLEDWGWEVREISGHDHSLWTHPAVVLPVVRPFLERVITRQ